MIVAMLVLTGCPRISQDNNKGNDNLMEEDDKAIEAVETHHEYVDLGLPSGTLWAICNVGATTPEGYGDCFAWGETEPKDYYDWDTYKHCHYDHEFLWPDFIKYCTDSTFGYRGFVDNLTVLQLTDDAASINWGNDWCTPTKEQWEELVQNTTNTITRQNGVKGMLFTANNGNGLFLPGAGAYFCIDKKRHKGFGRYWSSSLKADNPESWEDWADRDEPGVPDGLSYSWSFLFCCGLDCWYDYTIVECQRQNGLSVRPVRSVK